MPKYAILAAIAAATLLPSLAIAEENPVARMDRFEQRLSEMESRHKAETSRYKIDLQARDAEIARLRALVERRDATTSPSSIDQARADVLRDIQLRQTPQTTRTPISFNPNIAVIADALTNFGRPRSNDAYNRIDVREVELDLRAAVHPRADAVVILAFERDVENPIFPEDEPAEGPESSVNIEEAYLFLHNFGVPNLTAKLGRFHLRFGRQNLLHLHDLPTSDPPFVNQAFLSPESLADAGASFSYLLPNPWEQYIEIVAEVISGEGSASESPTLNGDLSVDSPAVNLHVLWNHDLTRDVNLELGASWLTGHADSDNRRDVNLFGLDATLIRTDPTGGFNNQLLQAELIYGAVDQDGGDTEHALGAYLLAQQQINRDWYLGLRLDWTENPNNAAEEAWGISPYVSWYWTDFLRFRLEYQHRDGDVPETDILFFQATWIFGAHPPHPYWSMR